MACTSIRSPARAMYLHVMCCIQSSGYRESACICFSALTVQAHIVSQYYSTEKQMSEHSILFITAVVRIAGNLLWIEGFFFCGFRNSQRLQNQFKLLLCYSKMCNILLSPMWTFSFINGHTLKFWWWQYDVDIKFLLWLHIFSFVSLGCSNLIWLSSPAE